LQALAEKGWVVGRNARFDYRWGAGQIGRYPAFAEELVALAPDVILGNGTATVRALQQTTRSVPIVFANITDPVGNGLVASLARPGGNTTGFIAQEMGFGGKWLELLKEVAPRVTRVAVVRDSAIASQVGLLGAMQSAAPALRIELRAVDVQDPDEIRRAITDFAREPHGGLIVSAGARAVLHRELIVMLAAQSRLPAVYPFRTFVSGGGLMSYGADTIYVYRQAAHYVDRILKGEKPADLPVQVPTKYELAINLKTAKALGLTVPPTLLARADEVIECNCVVGSGGFRLPFNIVAEHGVEGCDHLSHDRNDDDLGLLIGGSETFVEGFEGRVVSASAEGRHVEDVTDRHTTTVDTAMSPELAAIEVVRRETHKGGDLLAAHLPEFWQQGDEREGQHGANAGHRGQEFITLSESSIGGDHFGQAFVEKAGIGLEPCQAAFVEAPQHGVLDMGCLVLDRDMLVTQLSPHGYDLGELFNGLVPLHNSCRHNRDILCDQPCIEAIIFGQHTAGAGELTELVRVDTSHRQSRREQGTD